MQNNDHNKKKYTQVRVIASMKNISNEEVYVIKCM